ncbi:MAG: DUF6629 family protein [Terriglobales bacterium]
MCFSATANFVGSGVLGAVGVVTLTKVKHRRELLFAALPVLFAVHQFIEGTRLAGKLGDRRDVPPISARWKIGECSVCPRFLPSLSNRHFFFLKCR